MAAAEFEPSANPALRRLGFDPASRVVIFHADDLGMTRGSIEAFLDLQDAGIVTSGSIMVPCAQAGEMLALASMYPDLDLGVHLTAVCEWTAARWGPVLGQATVPDLCMPDGGFWPDQPTARGHARAKSLRRESLAQIAVARQAGLDPTHLDAHAVKGVFPELTLFYISLGFHYGVPVLLPRQMPSFPSQDRHTPGLPRFWRWLTARVEAAGMPLVDQFIVTPFDPMQPAPVTEGELVDRYERLIARIPPGLTYFALHPNTAEHPGHIAAASMAYRTFEHAYFQSARLQEFLQAQGIIPIGMRPLRDIMRATRRSRPRAQWLETMHSAWGKPGFLKQFAHRTDRRPGP